MPKIITNPTNIEMATKLCAMNPDSSYAKLLKFDAKTGELGVKDLSIFTSTPDIANEFISDMANKIVVQHTYDLFRGYEMPFKVFERAMSQLGDAEELLTCELASTNAYSEGTGVGETPSPFDATKPTIKLAWIKTEDKREIDVALSYEIWSGAFVNEQGLSNLSGIILKNLQDAIAVYLYGVIADDLSKATGGVYKITKSETIQAITGAGQTANAQKCYEQIIALALKMSLPSTSYNNNSVKTFTPVGKAVLVLNANYKASFDVNVLASLFNSAKIGENQYFSKVIVSDLDASTLGVILDEEAYMWGYRFNVSGSIYNPKTLKMNHYQHAWIKRAVVPFRNAVRLKSA